MAEYTFVGLRPMGKPEQSFTVDLPNPPQVGDPVTFPDGNILVVAWREISKRGEYYQCTEKVVVGYIPATRGWVAKAQFTGEGPSTCYSNVVAWAVVHYGIQTVLQGVTTHNGDAGQEFGSAQELDDTTFPEKEFKGYFYEPNIDWKSLGADEKSVYADDRLPGKDDHEQKD